MSARLAAALALLVAVLPVGVVMMTNDSLRIRQLENRVVSNAQASDRYVDIGVRLSIVVADAAGKAFVEGAPLLRVVGKPHLFGGLLDTRSNPPRIAGPSQEPRNWYCSEAQWRIIRHADEDEIGKLAIGGMGAGKTTAGAMWLYLRWIEAIDLAEKQRRQGLVTAPTENRVLLVLDEIKKLWRPNWFRFSTATNIATMCEGTTLRFVSTKRQSAAAGSPLQGFNASWWLADELQDQLEEFIHAQARLRSGVGGRAKRLGTATAKDDPNWRTFRAEREAAGDWTFHTMLGPESPFIHAAHWQTMQLGMSSHEYRRLVLAEDLPSELTVYYGWDRKRNLVLRPQIAKNVTAAVLDQYRSYIRPNASFGLVLGHDPGVIFNTTEIAELVMFGAVPTWMVVGEFQTKQTTQRQHAQQLKKYLRDNFYVDHPTIGGPWPIVFCDPHGKGEAQTDYRSVYMAFQGEGLDVFNPAPVTGKIKRSARIEMLNRLFGGSAADPGTARLVVAQRGGRPVAPKLVEALESLKKRPGDDNPEGTQRKDEDDKTHAPAALGYLLWPFEQEGLTAATQLAALRSR